MPDRGGIRGRIKRSQEQEARGAADHGGRVRPGSGSKAGAKGDMRTSTSTSASRVVSGTMWEYKRTDGTGIRLTATMLEKNRREALLEGRRPRLGLEIAGRDYVVMALDDYLELEESGHGGDG